MISIAYQFFLCHVSSEENKYLTKETLNSLEDCARVIHATTIDASQKKKLAEVIKQNVRQQTPANCSISEIDRKSIF